MDLEEFNKLSNIKGEIKGFSKLIGIDEFESNVKEELVKYQAKGVYLYMSHNDDISLEKIATIIENCCENLNDDVKQFFESETNQDIEKDKVLIKLFIFGI